MNLPNGSDCRKLVVNSSNSPSNGHYQSTQSLFQMQLRILSRKLESMERTIKELQVENARKDEEIERLQMNYKNVQEQVDKNSNSIEAVSTTQRMEALKAQQDSLATFLERVHLPELARLFMDHGYETVDDIVKVQWDHDKLERLGIHKMGHRDKLLLEIQQKREENVIVKAATTKSNPPRTGQVQQIAKHPKSTLLELCQRYERAMPKETTFEQKEQDGIKWWEATVEFEAQGMQKQRVTAQRTKKKEAETACFRELLSIYLKARNMVI